MELRIAANGTHATGTIDEKELFPWEVGFVGTSFVVISESENGKVGLVGTLCVGPTEQIPVVVSAEVDGAVGDFELFIRLGNLECRVLNAPSFLMFDWDNDLHVQLDVGIADEIVGLVTNNEFGKVARLLNSHVVGNSE